MQHNPNKSLHERYIMMLTKANQSFIWLIVCRTLTESEYQ